MADSKNIRSTTIGGDLFSAQDMIFDDTNLASSGDTTSSEFLLSQAMGWLELKIVAGADGCATGVAETLIISIKTAPESGGTFDDVIFLHTVTASTTFAAGETILSFIPPKVISEVYTKILITSNYDATGQEVTAYLVQV